MIHYDRNFLHQPSTSQKLEWLVTNGVGGYASGTVSGGLTRGYHGLLVAALNPPLGRTLLLSKLDEIASYAGESFALFSNHWRDGVIDPQGFLHLDQFHLEGTLPVWTFSCADAVLEKRVWMQQGQNTTYIQYKLVRGSLPLSLSLKALINHRGFHSRTPAHAWHTDVRPVPDGIEIRAVHGPTLLYLFNHDARIVPHSEWYQDFFLPAEAGRGQNALDNHFFVALLTITLEPGQTTTVVASTQPDPNLNGDNAHQRRCAYEQAVIVRGTDSFKRAGKALQGDEGLQHLLLAADQFIVERPLPAKKQLGHSIVAGYHWFGDWGRDAMISLPGLTLCTGREDIAASLLKTFSHYVDQGMLPNRFPDAGEEPEYNTVDASLWYFEAVRAFYEFTKDLSLLRELYPTLASIIEWHRKGTRYHIHVDEVDGLLYAGQPGVQLTWMDAKVGDWVVTPRVGKPVEINALWYNALCAMTAFSRSLKKPFKRYRTLAHQVQSSFERFWNEETQCCFDVIDGPDGNDGSLRPNQLLAVSLPHSPLDKAQQKAVVDACQEKLLTPHGLRSLSPDSPRYVGRYEGSQRERDAAYHQGTAWPWLMGPFVEAHLKVYGDPDLARSFLTPLLDQLCAYGVGSVGEIFDGDAPFTPRGCIAQAWSVAELLRAWRLAMLAKGKLARV